MSAPVQTVSAEDANTGSFGTTISVTLTSVHAGAPIWVAAGHGGNPNDPSNLTITVSDTVNGSWTTPLLTSVERAFDTCVYTFGLPAGASAAGSPTITVSWPGAGSLVKKWIIASEMPVGSVLDHTSANDQAFPTAGTADAVTSGTVANVAQPGLIIAASFVDDDNALPGPAAGTGFTSLGTTAQFGGANPLVRFETKAVTSTGVAATFTRPTGGAPGAGNGDFITSAAIYVDAGVGGVQAATQLRTQQRVKGFPPRAPLPGISRLGLGLLTAVTIQFSVGVMAATMAGTGGLSATPLIPIAAGMAQPRPMAYSFGMAARFPGPPPPLLGSGLLVAGATAALGPISATCAGSGGLGGAASAIGALAASATGVGALTAISAAQGALACTSTGAGTFAGTPQAAGALAATAAGAGTFACTASAAGALSASAAGAGALTAAGSAIGAFSGAAAGTGALTATSSAAGALAATAAGTGAFTAAGSASGALAATLVGAGTFAATALQAGSAGTCAGVGTFTATATATGAAVATCAGVGSLSASVSAAGALTGSAAGTGALTGVGSAAGALSASAAGAGAFAGAPTATGALAAAAAGAGAFVPTASANGALAATAAGIGALSGALLQPGNNAACVGVGTFSATASAIGSAAVSCGGASGLAAAASARGALSGAGAGTGGLSATGSATGALVSSATGIGALSGSMVQGSTAGTCAGVGSLSGSVTAIGFANIPGCAHGSVTLLYSATGGAFLGYQVSAFASLASATSVLTACK